jgi:HK97 family phage major capsid protein
MLTYLRRLVDERTSLTEIATRMADTAADENRDLTEPERAELVRMETRCAELDTQIGQHNGQVESARAYASLVERIEGNTAPRVPSQRDIGSAGRQMETTSPEQAFVESDAFRSYAGHGTSGRVPIDNYLEFRAAITTANLAIPHYVHTPVEQTFSPQIAPLVNVVRVSSGVVDWTVIGADPTAAVVAEGTAKPEATATFTPATAALDTIAHWYQITRQALEDATYIRSLLEGKLRRGLLKKVDADLLAAIVAGTPAQVGGVGVDANISIAIREAIGVVEGNGYNPNGVLVNPADYAAMDVAAASAPGGTPAVRTRTYWGLTTVPHPSVTAGTAYVGDFQEAVTLFDRGVTDVFLTDSHASLFISNILVILAEARVKAAVTEPGGLAKASIA